MEPRSATCSSRVMGSVSVRRQGALTATAVQGVVTMHMFEDLSNTCCLLVRSITKTGSQD